MQRFKSVYFADYPAPSTKKRSLKLAFGPSDDQLFEMVSRLSSEQLRGVLGEKFMALKTDAEQAGATVNSFCLERLRRATEPARTGQMAFPDIAEFLRLELDPIQVTFRGGVEEPLHDWYPYLEGYSPEFVQSAIDSFAPNARHVLDPFGGSGTTPLTVARRGLQGTYCELNPLLQFLVETKAEVLALPAPQRTGLARLLFSLADGMKSSVREHAPDRRLAASYAATFGDSEFFRSETFTTVLRLRSWLDSLDCTAPEAADVATVATAASLIPASNLVRRGDLRFRKGPGELRLLVEDLVGEVAARLRSMGQDLQQLEGVTHRPRLIASDAKRLDRVAHLGVDAVVTSPPYLNGTNYYRNTKVELWFLRALLSGRDLAAFRRKTITAGINDVTVDKNPEPASPSVAAIVKELEDRAYDRRIPQMALNYFADMAAVLDGVANHTRPGAPLLIDIGDSAYAGVHVDTPKILGELLSSKGWVLKPEVTLRQRLSRSGQPLRQVLLVAEARKPSTAAARTPTPWRRRWNKFKEELPHQRGDYAKRNWGSPLHSLCSYQGKMKPSLARHLVEAFVAPGGRMLDPFGGVGTIPFEAAMLGAKAWSFDISPAAVPIAAAKLNLATPAECAAVVAKLGAFMSSKRVTAKELESAGEIRFNGPLAGYFHPDTFAEILLARRFFQENPPSAPAAALVFACLLHVLHGNRPYALSRRSHPITPFAPTGATEYKSLVEKVNEKVERALAVDRPSHFTPGESVFQDATDLWPVEVDELDAVITSPPFFDSTRFYLANWMRLWFAGWTAEDFKRRPLAFVDERQKRDFSVYEPILRQARERLKPGGVCVLHLGKSRKCDMAERIAQVARPWFSGCEVFGESVEHCESHGIRDKGTVVEHTYLVLY